MKNLLLTEYVMLRSHLPRFVRAFLPGLAVLLLAGSSATAQQMAPAPGLAPEMVMAAPPPPPMRSRLGGGFIEFLFGGHHAAALPPPPAPQPTYAPPPRLAYAPAQQPRYVNPPPAEPMMSESPRHYPEDPRLRRQEVAYHGTEPPGTIVVDTPHHFLYLVESGGKAMRYGIGVARTGFAWSGVHRITAMKKWPGWTPPADMLKRQPYLPRFLPGGPNNPLGARALYIGHTLYRIHGSNEPWTIGHNVSSGCIRLRNADIIDLYKRVNVGTKVVVIGPHGSDRDYIPPADTNPKDIERG